MARTRTIEVGWAHEDEDFRLVCSVGPSDPGRRYMSDGSPGWPAEAGEVEILEIREDVPGGALRPDLLDAARRDFERIEEKARDEADEADRDAADAYDDFRSDCARDERRGL